jgi:hypothetical protein
MRQLREETLAQETQGETALTLVMFPYLYIFGIDFLLIRLLFLLLLLFRPIFMMHNVEHLKASMFCSGKWKLWVHLHHKR